LSHDIGGYIFGCNYLFDPFTSDQHRSGTNALRRYDPARKKCLQRQRALPEQLGQTRKMSTRLSRKFSSLQSPKSQAGQS
jgi:hypothetical protein